VQKGVRNDARDAQSGVRSAEQGATSDVMRATTSLPPNKNSNLGFALTSATLRPQGGRPYSAPGAQGYRNAGQAAPTRHRLDATRPGALSLAFGRQQAPNFAQNL
jgi:hypothetical protein